MTSSESLKLVARIERWPIAGSFTISRGAKTEAVTVVAEVSRGSHTGRGECVPYPRYGETPEATLAALLSMRDALRQGLDRPALQAAMPSGAARNALDCALLDLEAKTTGQRIWNLLGRPAPRACITAYTISLGSPEAMAAATATAAHRPLLKIKLGCMVATSLAMAPAMLLAPEARFVDLDGPLLLARDRDGGLRYDGSLVYPPDAALWG